MTGILALTRATLIQAFKGFRIAPGEGFTLQLLSIQHHVRKWAANADEAPALLQIKIVQCKSEVLVHLPFEALYNTGDAGAAAAIVGEPEPSIFGFFEDVL